MKALSIGSTVPADFSAVVHSAFRSALNLRVINENTLLTLTAADQADLPQGIRIETPPGFLFEKFQAGETAIRKDNLLRLASLTIDLHNAPRWVCDLPALEADLSSPQIFFAWRFAWDALNERQRKHNAEIVAQDLLSNPSTAIQQKMETALLSLLDSTRRLDPVHVDASLHSLIGLGPGLTPAGDDLLVGLCAGLWCSVQYFTERRKFLSGFGDAVMRLSSRTNDISRAYLIHAARGQVSSRLAHLAEAICRPASRDLPAAFHSAAETGHTSGMDAVTGLLFGLEAWSARMDGLARQRS